MCFLNLCSRIIISSIFLIIFAHTNNVNMKKPKLFKEYIWLVETIHQAGSITFSDINKRWIKTGMSGGVEMARTTFYRHKCAIEDIFGIFIDCDKKNGNKYFIGNKDVLHKESVQNWMLSTLSVSNMVGESSGLYNRILLENIPSGDEGESNGDN